MKKINEEIEFIKTIIEVPEERMSEHNKILIMTMHHILKKTLDNKDINWAQTKNTLDFITLSLRPALKDLSDQVDENIKKLEKENQIERLEDIDSIDDCEEEKVQEYRCVML